MKIADRYEKYYTDACDNLRSVFVRALSTDVIAGLYWYDRARERINTLAENYGYQPYEVAGLIAILSPKNKWENNLVDAEKLLIYHADGKIGDVPKCYAYGLNVAKGLVWLDGEDTMHGPKVTAFYANLTGSDEDVTVDTWMHRASGLEGVLTPQKQRIIAQAVRDLAHGFNLKPCALQAIIWCTVLREAA